MTADGVFEDDWFPRPVPDNVSLGERSWLYGAFAFAHYRSERPLGVHIGTESGIYDGTFFELGPHGSVDVGAHCMIVSAVIATNGPVSIGDYTFVSWDVVIADDAAALPADERAPGWHAKPSSPIRIGRTAWIGARARVFGGVTIGDNAIVGSGAIVDRDVPDGAIVAGNPFRIVGRAASR